VGFVGGETGYCSETCVTGGVGGTGEGSVKVEDAIDIKEEGSVKVEDAIDIKEEGSVKVEDSIDIEEEGSVKVEDSIDIEEEIPENTACPPINTEHEVRLNFPFLPLFSILDAIYLLKLWFAILMRRNFLEVVTIKWKDNH
jgi:hypothetical protein